LRPAGVNCDEIIAYMRKSMHEMDEQGLGALIEKLSQSVEHLADKKPGSVEHNLEAGVLRDARQLLTEKRKKKASDALRF
jgi:hypothetical protein